MLRFTICFTILFCINLFRAWLLCGSCLQKLWKADPMVSSSLWSLSMCSRRWAVFPVVEKGWKNRRPKYGSQRLILPLGVQKQLGRQSSAGSWGYQRPVPFLSTSACLYWLQPPSLSNFEQLSFFRRGNGHSKRYSVHLTSSKIKSFPLVSGTSRDKCLAKDYNRSSLPFLDFWTKFVS